MYEFYRYAGEPETAPIPITLNFLNNRISVRFLLTMRYDFVILYQHNEDTMAKVIKAYRIEQWQADKIKSDAVKQERSEGFILRKILDGKYKNPKVRK
jgi:hypothetical protein